MKPIIYLKGDATVPQASGIKIIAHICNDIGGWGKGFVVAISRRWKVPEQSYREWHRLRSSNDFSLGNIRLIQVAPYIHIANMIGQRGIKTGSNGVPVRYDAIRECLSKLSEKAKDMEASIHMPRIGCGLAGGTWNKIEPIITETLCIHNLAVYIYDF